MAADQKSMDAICQWVLRVDEVVIGSTCDKSIQRWTKMDLGLPAASLVISPPPPSHNPKFEPKLDNSKVNIAKND